MARPKRFSELRRQLIRRLPKLNEPDIRSLRDQLWDVLIARKFKSGHSIDYVASDQPNRGTVSAIEAAIRRRMR